MATQGRHRAPAGDATLLMQEVITASTNPIDVSSVWEEGTLANDKDHVNMAHDTLMAQHPSALTKRVAKLVFTEFLKARQSSDQTKTEVAVARARTMLKWFDRRRPRAVDSAIVQIRNALRVSNNAIYPR